MARRPTPGNCTYCSKYSDKLTWDHVFPLSWYPNITPKNIEKWKVPVCLKCNKKFGVIEEDLLLKLGLCLDPKSIASLGISHKALRSLNPDYGKNVRDKKIREKKREKILAEIVHFDELPQNGIFPNFGPYKDLLYYGYQALSIPEPSIKSYAEKLVRGMSFIIDGVLLDENYQIELYVIREGGDPEIEKLFRNHSSLYHRGLGFVVRRIIRDDEKAYIYEFLIWQKLLFYVVVHPGDMEE